MHAVGVERVPAGAFGAAAVALQIKLAVGVEKIVLAGNVMHVEPRLRNDAVGIVELRVERQMADVAGMDQKSRLLRLRIDLGDGLFQRAERIRIGRLVEADMTVADLQEGQPLGFGRGGFTHDTERVRHAAGYGPQHAGADPGHAFQHFAPAGAVITIGFAHCRSPLKGRWPRNRYGRWLLRLPRT